MKTFYQFLLSIFLVSIIISIKNIEIHWSHFEFWFWSFESVLICNPIAKILVKYSK